LALTDEHMPGAGNEIKDGLGTVVSIARGPLLAQLQPTIQSCQGLSWAFKGFVGTVSITEVTLTQQMGCGLILGPKSDPDGPMVVKVKDVCQRKLRHRIEQRRGRLNYFDKVLLS
jgi:hypothetical protein